MPPPPIGSSSFTPSAHPSYPSRNTSKMSAMQIRFVDSSLNNYSSRSAEAVYLLLALSTYPVCGVKIGTIFVRFFGFKQDFCSMVEFCSAASSVSGILSSRNLNNAGCVPKLLITILHSTLCRFPTQTVALSDMNKTTLVRDPRMCAFEDRF